MPATITFLDDADVPITQWPFGIISENNFVQYKFKAKNTGTANATSVILKLVQTGTNDGADFITFAPDVDGNPGTYAATDIAVGTLAPDAEYTFWVKVTVPSNSSPIGNPRSFYISASYNGI
jgi:hypothetical protein